MPEESKLADTYEKATSAVKFSEEEMKELDGIQSTYFEVQNKFGAVAVTRLRLEQQLNDMNQYTDELRKNFIDNQEEEKKFLEKIREKYGDGNLDLESGVFIPNKTENNSK